MLAMPKCMTNIYIYAKFRQNNSFKYADIMSREIDVNGQRPDNLNTYTASAVDSSMAEGGKSVIFDRVHKSQYNDAISTRLYTKWYHTKKVGQRDDKDEGAKTKLVWICRENE